MKIARYECDLCKDKWDVDSKVPYEQPESLYVTLSDCCWGQINQLDYSFRHLCRSCVRYLSEGIARMVENRRNYKS